MRYTLCFLSLIFILAFQQLAAQQVLITVGVTPPYSPYLSNYTSTDANKVFMTLQNTTGRSIQVRLTGSAVGDNGVSLKSKQGFVPTSIITLAPFQVRQMNGSALSEVFDLNNFDVTGIDRNTLARTLRLPEGNYNLCVQAVDNSNGQVVSGGAPLGCTLLSITYPEPPVLVTPLPGDSVNAATPQTLVFTWMNPGSVPIGTEYTIQLQEMPQRNANPNQILMSATFPLLSQRVKTTSYVYSIGNLALKQGSQYAWRVVANDPSGRTNFKNNGVSAAGVFQYGRTAPVFSRSEAVRKDVERPMLVPNKVEVNGALYFQYHMTGNEPNAPFKGIKADTLPLVNEQIQLCYGLCRVKMDLKSKQINQVVANSAIKNTTLPKDVKITPVGKDSSRLTFYHTDSIPNYGVPNGFTNIEPAGNMAGGLGQVIATTTTDETGTFNFSAYTNKWSSIVETYSDQTALVYCFYINIKNKHYSDPRNFIYLPVENANNALSIGFSRVYLDTYSLNVRVNRDHEVGTNKGEKQNVSVENKADGMADIYILRKSVPGLTGLPASEGDNSGKIKFESQADKQPSFTKFASYQIIAKRTAATVFSSGFGNASNTYSASATFHNLVNNIDSKESYYVYVEYKGSSVYFDPQEYKFSLNDLPEYRPEFFPPVNDLKMELKPSYVAIRIKGVMKYQFKNRTPAPLPNTKISFRNIYYYSGDVGNGKKGRVYDLKNEFKHNTNYVTTTTDANGTFELNAGNIEYESYYTGFAFVQGLDQFITVDNGYYGSPDKPFNFQSGNTYNVGELVAQVKEYSLSPVISGKNVLTGLMQKLAGQRVFLCRKAGVNPVLWGVPADEGVQKNIPTKQIKDIDGVTYNVIGYGETNSSGTVKLDGLVARDFQKSEDQYYLYSESGNMSMENYSTQYGQPAGVGLFSKYLVKEYYTSTEFVLNSSFEKEKYNLSPAFEAVALTPFIEGGVYPESNTSTNALPGVDVLIYDIPQGTLSAETLEARIKKVGVLPALLENKVKLQDNRKTTTTGIFNFNDVTGGGKYKGWKILRYSKPGFIDGYTIINSGKPMVAGTKQTVKGFVLPPQLVHVTIKDAETGVPVGANIVVGNEFSWGSQQLLKKFSGKANHYDTYTLGADLTTPFGTVQFTVIPEDNVHYQTQTFTQTVLKTAAKQNLPDFTMYSRRNRITVCLLDATNNKGLAGTATILDVPAAVNPAPQPVFLKLNQCQNFSFASNQPYYRVQVTSTGYVTQTITVTNNTDEEIPKDLLVKMQPGMTISGTVTVDGNPVKDAKVYVKEMPALSEVLTDAKGNYSFGGLPKNNAKVTLTAVKPGMNAVGQSKSVTLGYDSNDAPSGQSSGNSTSTTTGSAKQNTGTTSNKKPVTANKPGNISSAIDKDKNYQTVVNQLTNQKQVHFSLVSNNDLDLNTLYGFPLEAEGLETVKGVTWLTGRVRVAGNTTFGIEEKQAYLHFSRLKVIAATGKSDIDKKAGGKQYQAKAKIIAASGSVEMDDDEVPVTVFGKYTATLNAFQKGIVIKSAGNTSGTIEGTVLFNSDAVAGNVQWEGSTTLAPPARRTAVSKGDRKASQAQRQKSGMQRQTAGGRKNDLVELSIPVFVSGSELQSEIASTYYFENEEAGLYYKLNNIYDVDANANSNLKADGLHLMSTIHTQLQNVSKPDLKLSVGEIVVTNKAMADIIGTDTISIPLDNWRIKSGYWYIESGALHLNGNLEAGAVTLPVTGLEVSESTIGFGELKLNQVGIAGVYKLDINQNATLTSFGYDKAAQYGTLYDKKYGCWSLSLLPKEADGVLTQLANLHDLAQYDKLNIKNISLYSKGNESRIILTQNHPSVTLNSFASFKPYEVENGSDYLKINGALNFTIPGFTGTESAPYVLNYTASAKKLVHIHAPIAGLKLTTNGIRTDFSVKDQEFTGNRLVLKGELRDKVTKSPYMLNVIFKKDNTGTTMVVDTVAKNEISLGAGQLMNKITGNMKLNGQQWENFRFEGDLAAEGMTTDKPSHMGFEVKGDLVANKAQLGVKNMPLPAFVGGTFNLTYDFDKKAVVGSMQLDNVSTPAADFSAAVEMQMGNGQWYLLGALNVTEIKIIPLPLNGAGAAFCLGHAPLTPDKLQIIQPVFHNGVLPNDFVGKFSQINGALFVAGIDVKLPLPNIDIDLGVANVHVGYGIYANAYAGLNFDEGAPVVSGGLKVGAYVNVNGGASIGIACAGVSLGVEVNAQGNLKMILPKLKNASQYLLPHELLKASTIDLNVQVGAELKGSAYVGVGVCNSSCNAVRVLGVKVPPGCHKESIGKTLTVNLGLDIKKSSGVTTPDQACLYIELFGTSYPGYIDPVKKTRPNNIKIPHL